jgi:hypothetical protein
MSKYPYFGKKGRPTKEEADLCKNINRLVNSGEVSESEINQLIETDGIPTNMDELQDMYSYLTGKEVKRTSNKLYTGEEEGEEDYEEEDYEEEDYEEEINTSESFNNVGGKKDAVAFDPFSEPVIERAYTKGINSSNQEEENDVEFDENDFEQPKGGENVADKINSGNSISEEQGEEDIPEPEWAISEEQGEEEDYDEDEDEDEDSGKLGEGNLEDLSPAQKRKSAEKTADAILQMYCKFAPTPFKSWARFKDTTIQKMVIDGRLDLNMQLENGVTVKDYIDGTNEQVDEIFEVSEETRQEIKDPLVDVLLEQEIALTPTQRLMIAVGSHVVQMGFSAYQLSQNNKMALESFEKFHNNMRKTNPQYQQQEQARPNPEPRNTIIPDDRITNNDRQAVDELMKELNKDDDGIIDAEHDPSIEIIEDYSDED